MRSLSDSGPILHRGEFSLRRVRPDVATNISRFNVHKLDKEPKDLLLTKRTSAVGSNEKAAADLLQRLSHIAPSLAGTFALKPVSLDNLAFRLVNDRQTPEVETSYIATVGTRKA